MDIQAWAFLDHKQALGLAQTADARRAAGGPVGALHGLPIGVKDIIDTANMPTEYNSRIYKGRQPTADATVVARLRSAGAIVVGKTVTSKFAVYTPGPNRNPHNQSRTPGGSSSGSAAIVATRMVPVALATQTNGSIIRPDRVFVVDRDVHQVICLTPSASGPAINRTGTRPSTIRLMSPWRPMGRSWLRTAMATATSMCSRPTAYTATHSAQSDGEEASS